MNFLIFRDFFRFFLNFSDFFMNFSGFFGVKNRIFYLKIEFSDFYKRIGDVAQSGASDHVVINDQGGR